jgi:hypothetical protein
MRPAEGGFRVFSLAVVAIAIAAFAGVGYLVGRVERTSQTNAANVRASAASVTYRRAETSAYHRGFRAQYGHGVAGGAAAGGKAGARLGRSAGRAAAASLAITDQAKALAAALASTPVSLKRRTKTHTCVPVGGGLCEVLGPGVTGKGCPRASAPSAEGGIVCVPEVLVEAARAAGVPGIDTLTGDASPPTTGTASTASTASSASAASTASGLAATPTVSSTTP